MNTYEKMREALEQSANLLDRILVRTELDDEIHRIALEAQNMADGVLSLSPRNCDVGTAEEQEERFENFCLKHIGCAEETGDRHCVGCPLEKASRNITQKCEMYWAQMPYEEGGAK